MVRCTPNILLESDGSFSAYPSISSSISHDCDDLIVATPIDRIAEVVLSLALFAYLRIPWHGKTPNGLGCRTAHIGHLSRLH
jgi:hypothetical protein